MINIHLVLLKLLDYNMKMPKPCTSALLEAIQESVKMTFHVKCLPLSNKSRRLFHVDFLIKITMQKYILDVKLKQIPLMNKCNGKEKSDRCHFGNMRESIRIILFIDLFVSLGDLMSFIAINLIILLLGLVLKVCNH